MATQKWDTFLEQDSSYGHRLCIFYQCSSSMLAHRLCHRRIFKQVSEGRAHLLAWTWKKRIETAICLWCPHDVCICLGCGIWMDMIWFKILTKEILRICDGYVLSKLVSTVFFPGHPKSDPYWPSIFRGSWRYSLSRIRHGQGHKVSTIFDDSNSDHIDGPFRHRHGIPPLFVS